MGLGSNNSGQNKTFLSINGGKIKQSSSEGTPGAEKREWEAPNGATGVKWEITHDFIEGNIVGLNFRDGDYGTSLSVDIQDGNSMYSLQLSTKSRYYDDFAKKVKALDLEKAVKIMPFDFEAEDKKNGGMKKIMGISLYQEGEKIMNHYWNGKKSINKMPTVNEKEKEELGKEYWTIYFVKVGAFLKKEIEGVKVPDAKPIKADSLSQETAHAESVSDESDDLPF